MESTISYSNRERYGTLLGILFGHFGDGLDLVIISYLFVPLSIEFKVSVQEIAIALTISLVFSAFGGLLFGAIADRFGRKKGLLLSIAVFGLSTMATAAVGQLWQLYLVRAIEGLGIGGEWGIGFAQITEVWSPKWRATGGGILQGVFIIGSLTGAFTAGYTLTRFGEFLGWRYAFVIAGIVALVGVIIILVAMPESKYWARYKEIARKKKEQGVAEKTPLSEIFQPEVRRWTLFALLIGGSNLFIYFSYSSFMPTLLAIGYGLTPAKYTTMLVLGQAIAVPFYWVNGFVSDIIGRKPTAIGYGAAYIIAVVIFLVSILQKEPYLTVFSFGLFYAYTFVSIGQGISGEYGVWYSEHFPTRMRSTATNFGYMVGRGIAGALASLLVPIIYSGLGGIRFVGLAMSIAMLVGSIFQFGGLFGLKET
ncbi:MAG: MFS transporter, partial [Thermoplasmataceae archaeon]